MENQFVWPDLVPSGKKYINAYLIPVIKEALQDMPVVVITGMRQAGKSTFLKMEAGLKGRRYVTLDDFAYLSAAREDPESFIDYSHEAS